MRHYTFRLRRRFAVSPGDQASELKLVQLLYLNIIREMVNLERSHRE